MKVQFEITYPNNETETMVLNTKDLVRNYIDEHYAEWIVNTKFGQALNILIGKIYNEETQAYDTFNIEDGCATLYTDLESLLEDDCEEIIETYDIKFKIIEN